MERMCKEKKLILTIKRRKLLPWDEENIKYYNLICRRKFKESRPRERDETHVRRILGSGLDRVIKNYLDHLQNEKQRCNREIRPCNDLIFNISLG